MKKEFIPPVQFKGKKLLLSWINHAYSVRQLHNQQFDLFHPTYYDPYFYNKLKGKRFVLTVHDMTQELFPDLVPVNDETSQRKKYLVDRAERIIAVSENTKKDLIEIWGINKDRIDVVYHGNSMVISNLNTKIPGIPEKYLLYVGSRHRYKNFFRFIRAITPFLKIHPEINLVCAGGGTFSKSELTLLHVLEIRDQVLQFNFDDSSLPLLYKNAMMFIFPSLYEGFGIPILEAFACECPIACSNNSCLPEIASDAAVYFDPFDEDAISWAVQELFYKASLREDLIKRGSERLSYFSWVKAAQETKNVYDKCIEGY
nr:glycosyltransferase family 1 protein [Maribellus sediminis]